jgi:broad specificity phosphatase PhoE
MKESSRDLTIYLVRHVPVINPNQIWYGETIEYDDKSPRIKKYFKALAQNLPHNVDTTIWQSSPYPRALATANGVLSELDATQRPILILNDCFVEQQYGIMTGKRHQEIANDPRVMAYMNDMWDTAPEDGESLSMFQQRIGGGLDNLVETTPPHIENVVIFSHGGVAMASFSHVTKQRMIDVFKKRKQRDEIDFIPSFSYQSSLTLLWSGGVWHPPSYISGLNKDAYHFDRT